MAKKAKKETIAPSQAEANVGEILSRSEKFIETYKNHILIGVTAVILIVIAVLGFRHAYYLPKEKEAQSAIFPAEYLFEQQKWEEALNGNDADNIGFLGVIDNYGITKTAKLAHAYAGICYFHLGNPEDAMDHLKKFDANDKLVSPVVTGLIGDCYVQLGDLSQGIDYFKKAASKAENELIAITYLKKAATAYESQKDSKGALDIYNKIKSKYPTSGEAQDIQKYIDRIELQLN